MKVGSIVYATDQGLGVLAKSFYDNGVVTDVMVVRHGRRDTHMEWYPGAVCVNSVRDSANIDRLKDFCASMDVCLFFETPFVWDVILCCKRSVLMPMHECMPERLPHVPSAIVAPSLLDQRCYPGSTFIPVPVDVPWKRRYTVNTFVHNVGHGGLRGRNGTKELLEALSYVVKPTKLIVRSQDPLDVPTHRGVVEIDYRFGTVPFSELYMEGDVFVFPEKFNGLSLPLQEAFASGMAVMATDRFPMNTWLPNPPLVRSWSSNRARVGPPYREFDEAVVDPRDIALKMDEMNGSDIYDLSTCGREFAEENSWETLRSKYLEILAG